MVDEVSKFGCRSVKVGEGLTTGKCYVLERSASHIGFENIPYFDTKKRRFSEAHLYIGLSRRLPWARCWVDLKGGTENSAPRGF